MHELYLEKPGDLNLRQGNSPVLRKKSDVKVSVKYGGICGSDLRVYKGLLPYAVYPGRPGHEILGTVIEAGPDSLVKVGTKIVSFPNTYCGECEFCKQGKTNICQHKECFGVTIDGFFAQDILLDSKYAVPIPDSLAEERAILIEPFAVNVHALKKANIKKGTSMAVIGCGTEGLLSIALANYLGADLTVIDVNPVKLEKARSFGSHIKTKHPKDVGDATFDVVVEAAGVKASFEQAMQIVKPGGSLIALGLTSDSIIFPSMRIVRSEITIYGTIIYTKKDFEDAVVFLEDPNFNVSPVLSKIVPFKEAQQAFDDAMSGNFAKIVLNFEEA